MVAIFGVVFLGIVLGVSLLVLTGVYNSLLSIQKQVNLNWNTMEDFIHQREGFLPDFLNILREVAPREKSLFDKLDEVKKRYQSAENLEDKITISNEMTNVLSSLFLIGDAYPQLRKNLKYKELRAYLLEIEDHLAKRQEHFNHTIKVYNQRTQQFPDIIFAQTLGFPQLDFIKVYEENVDDSDMNYRLAA